MKKGLIFLLLFVSLNSFAQIVGGAGICNVNSDPNTINSIKCSASNQTCKICFNSNSNTFYYYNDTYACGSKWVTLSLSGADGVVTGANFNNNLLTLTRSNGLPNLTVTIPSGTTYAAGSGITIASNNVISTQFNGNYNNLTNLPTIPPAQVQSDWTATTGLGVILNKPLLPSAQVNSDWNATSGLAQILNKPSIPASQVQTDWNATSGIGVLLNKPTIPPAQVKSDWTAISGVTEILNKPTIKNYVAGANVTVAQNTTTGNYEISTTAVAAISGDGVCRMWNGTAYNNAFPFIYNKIGDIVTISFQINYAPISSATRNFSLDLFPAGLVPNTNLSGTVNVFAYQANNLLNPNPQSAWVRLFNSGTNYIISMTVPDQPNYVQTANAVLQGILMYKTLPSF